MGDYSCQYCQDYGDCTRCSYFFEKNTPHTACGRLWRDHQVTTQDGGVYPPYTTCPEEGR